MLNLGALAGYVPDPQLLLVGSGAAILVLVSALMMRRRLGSQVPEVSGDATEVNDRLLDYITEHQGSISMSKASKELGVSADELDEAIMRLKADGKLPS